MPLCVHADCADMCGRNIARTETIRIAMSLMRTTMSRLNRMGSPSVVSSWQTVCPAKNEHVIVHREEGQAPSPDNHFIAGRVVHRAVVSLAIVAGSRQKTPCRATAIGA